MPVVSENSAVKEAFILHDEYLRDTQTTAVPKVTDWVFNGSCQ